MGRSEFEKLSSRDRLHLRTRELATMAGRSKFEINQGDYEQAKRELSSESDADRQNAVLDNGMALRSRVAVSLKSEALVAPRSGHS